MLKSGIILLAATLLVVGPASAFVADTGGFEGYDLGSVVGQSIRGGAGTPAWQAFSSPNQPDPQIVDLATTGDAALAGRGKVLSFSPEGFTSGAFTGAFLPLGDLVAAGSDRITVQFDQYRVPTAQELFISEAPEVFTTGWAARQYGLNGRFYPNDDLVSSPSLPLKAGVWQSVRLDLDYANLLATLTLDGQTTEATALDTMDPTFRGLALAAFATARTPNTGPNYFDNLVITTNGAIPEPGTLALLTLGVLPLLRRKRG